MEQDTLDHLIARFAQAAEHLDAASLADEEGGMRAALKEQNFDVGELIRPQTDEILARALQKGFFFLDVYNELFARYEGRIRSWLMRWGVDYHRAFDLMQMLMLVCFKTRLHRYCPSKGTLAGYLRRTAWNLQVRPAPHACTQLPENLAAPRADAEEAAAGQEMEQRIHQAMAELPTQQRAVLELALEGNSHAEIAQRLGIGVRESERSLFKARRTLEERLGLTLPPSKRGRPRLNPPPSDLS